MSAILSEALERAKVTYTETQIYYALIDYRRKALEEALKIAEAYGSSIGVMTAIKRLLLEVK